MGSEVNLGKSFKNFAQKYIKIGFVMGFFLVLLTYFTVSEQFALSAPHAISMPVLDFAAKTSPGNPHTGAGEEKKIETKPADPEKDKVSKEVQEKTQNEVMIHESDKVEQLENGRRGAGLQGKDGSDGSDENQNVFSTAVAKETAADIKQSGGEMENAKPVCDVDNPASETCDIAGDVRTNGTGLSVYIVPGTTGNAEAREWQIRPYSRKRMNSISKVTVKQLGSPQEAPSCSINENVPAIVFALGGLAGNYWHDFSDVMVPLFIASRQYDGQVQFLVSNIQPWWLGKYEAIIKRLSKYELIDFDKDKQIRCFRRVTVGLRMHKEFSINPSWAPGGYSMSDFTEFLRETYSLPRDSPISLKHNPGKKPRLLLIVRGHYRKFTNVPDIAQCAERVGFEVVVIDPKFDVRIADFARTVNSFDVLLGVHGAGLTNAVFLPTDAVVIQVVPYGNLEHMAKVDFGDPIVDMKLKYLEYSISAEESTLMDMFGKDHPVIKDPVSIHKSGWDKVAEFYLGKQDVRIDVNRFSPTLFQALEHFRNRA